VGDRLGIFRVLAIDESELVLGIDERTWTCGSVC
jgi:hypothetical protein